MRVALVVSLLVAFATMVAVTPPVDADVPKCPVEAGRGQMWGAAICFDREAESCRLYYETWGEFHYDKECLA